MEVLGRGNRNSPQYRQLHALHCIDYSEMPEALKNQIPVMINELLRNEEQIVVATDVALSGIFN